jgi:hypothetical protein
MAEALVTLLGEPKKYGVLVDRNKSKRSPGRTKRNGTGVGREGRFSFGQMAAMSK